MRRFLAAAAIAVVLPLASVSVANADPNAGEELRCSTPVQVAPDINVKTCTYYFWWNYGSDWSHRARITVRNTSTVYPVYVTPELLVDGAVYVSPIHTINPGTEYEVWGNQVKNLPWNARKTARGYLEERGWWTHTYAPSFP